MTIITLDDRAAVSAVATPIVDTLLPFVLDCVNIIGASDEQRARAATDTLRGLSAEARAAAAELAGQAPPTSDVWTLVIALVSSRIEHAHAGR